ncbi:MAG: DUF6531 domain-containing protein [Paralcaligenes sp.]
MTRYLRALAGLLALSAGTALAAAELSCNPSPLGQPCARGGLATLADNPEPSLNLGVGNPIHLVTGNKYQQELDLPGTAQAPDLEIRRHYNSLDRRHSVLGPGWALSYDTRLFHAGGRMQIVQADGSRISFARTGEHSGGAGRIDAHEQQWIWTWPNGQKNRYDRHGRLVHISFAGGQMLVIQRQDAVGPEFGTISRLLSGQGLALDFSYQIIGDRAYLSRIDTPLGAFRYTYQPVITPSGQVTGPWRLDQVIRPDGMRRRYLYEPLLQAGNPYHLTGIETVSADGARQKRNHTWAYDVSGRATLSILGGPQEHTGRITLRYVKAPSLLTEGATVVTNASGEKTTFHVARKGGRYLLTRVNGAPCPGCAAPRSQALYDNRGRLTHINGTGISRTAAGAIESLSVPSGGWPDLTLHYQAQGSRTSWSSTLTGTERTLFDARLRPIERTFANGDRWNYRYDAAGRPVQLLEQNAREKQVTVLSWRGPLLTRIHHPHESESRRYDAQNRLTQRRIQRRLAPSGNVLRYTEQLSYDNKSRLIKHRLPEGGALHYQWDKQGRLQAIAWHDAQGNAHRVIESVASQPGYQYGNGLQLQTRLTNGQASELLLHHEGRPVWSQHQHYGPHGLVQQEQHRVPSQNHAQTWNYTYDQQSRLIGAHERLAESAQWYAWHNDGALAAQRLASHTVKPAITRDASGLPTSYQGYLLEYGPSRRLTGARLPDQLPDVYRHNALGQRIAKISAGARTDYFYLNNQLVAESQAQKTEVPNLRPAAQANITRRYIYAGLTLVGLIDYAPADASGSTAPGILYAAHSDLLGAPRMLTDGQRKIRWLATYSPTGAATQIAGDLTLDLRLPGQIADRSTGWHDNLLRTYLPDLGQYLEPDPLGPIPANQALGYANQQAKRYVDPLGLLLFAFDGTRNSPISQTNVWKMSQRYQDGPIFYQSGPGNPSHLDWDAVTAYSAPAIIDAQWQSLLDALDGASQEIIPIDILGYSRGAALARHFGNLLNQHTEQGLFSYTDSVRGLVTACLDLRFMGLFDTVAQFGLGGTANTQYDLSIASAWGWVAHAVALQERRWLYPLATAAGGPGMNTVEAPFIGSHADIGGGMDIDDRGQPNSRGDLSDVALNWMLWQARAALLRFDTAPLSDREITEPIVHDQRSALARAVQSGDRRVDGQDGSPRWPNQDDHPQLGHLQRNTSEELIQRIANWRSMLTTEVGTVDMRGYAQWLQNELGWQALPV